MATAIPSPTKKEDFKEQFLSCSICTELYDNNNRQAKLLSCQHVFCKKCLQSHAAGRGSSFPCPNCRKLIVNTVDNLPNSLAVENLKDYNDVIDSSVSCGNCKLGLPAISYCHYCGCFQCEKCVQNHRDMSSLHHHKLSSLSELEQATPQGIKKAYRIKFLVIGATATGKTSVQNYFIHDAPCDRMATVPTVAYELGVKKIEIGNTKLEIRVWDTAGQELFRAITKSYYRDAHGALVVYDITKRHSYDDVGGWLNEIKKYNPNIITVLCGNKKDLEDTASPDGRQVSLMEASLFAQENGLMFLETSAKTGENVHEAFQKCANAIIEKIKSGALQAECIDEGNPDRRRSTVNLNQEEQQRPGFFRRTYNKLC